MTREEVASLREVHDRMLRIINGRQSASAAKLYLLAPTVLGGLVSIPYLHMLYRGHPDPLTEALSNTEARGLMGLIEGEVRWPLVAENLEPLHLKGRVVSEQPHSPERQHNGGVELTRCREQQQSIAGMFDKEVSDQRDVVLDALSRVEPRNPRSRGCYLSFS